MPAECDADDAASPSRRRFLTGAGAAAFAGLAAASCSSDDARVAPPPIPATIGDGPTPPPLSSTLPPVTAGSPVPFRSDVQQAVLLAPAAAGILASFDVVGATRSDLVETFTELSGHIEQLMDGRTPEAADDFLPPVDAGLLGAGGSAGTAISLAVGSSLFDTRFGLADRRPADLIAMPRFFNDRLVRDDFSHGDLALTISAPTQQLTVYALQQIVRAMGRKLRLRWVQEGYNHLVATAAPGVAPVRNLMGFRDGTSNLDTNDPAAMAEHVWVQPGDAEPDWAAGGTYQAVRVIRMLIEFWATAALVRQEQIFGRHRDSGAPLGQSAEGELPAFANDPADETVPTRSHMRLANPRTPGTGRILRRGFSYLNGADSTGTLDQGLLFIAYQRSLRRGFLEVQSRLDGEPLEDYIKPVGGGFFFVLPGPGSGGDGWLGESLLS